MKPIQNLAAGLLMLLPLASVHAVEPNIEPGMWSYTNTTHFVDAPMQMPPQTHENRECITLEDLQRGDAFLQDAEECTASNIDLRRDGMDYTMTCRSPDGATAQMHTSMRFMGDRVQGTVEAEMESPMGPMKMRIEVEGRRIGDC